LINKKLQSIQERTEEQIDFHKSEFTLKIDRQHDALQNLERDRK